jgi:hypothetical protein
VKTLRGFLLPAAMVLIGVALIVKFLLAMVWIGVVLGVLFVAAGAGRIYVERHL